MVLLLLQKFGVIKLKDPSNIRSTAGDIAENPKKLQFRELEAALLPRVLEDVDLALINTNYALEAGLTPTSDALLLEGLFQLALAGDIDSCEFEKIEQEVHARLVASYPA